jgi:hypothetical protein
MATADHWSKGGSREQQRMRQVTKQQRLALRHAQVSWSEQVEDPREERCRRHVHQGLLALLVVGFACGKAGLNQIEELSEDLGWAPGAS